MMTLARAALLLWTRCAPELRAAGIPSAFRVYLGLQDRAGIARIADTTAVRFRVRHSATHQEVIGSHGEEIEIPASF